MDKAEQIMSKIIEVANGIGFPVEIDRAYPVMADPRGGAPDHMPLVVVRTGDEEQDDPDAKAWAYRWVMTPNIVVFLQNKQDPDSLRSQANQIFLKAIDDFKKSSVQSLLTRTKPFRMSKSLQPVSGRPDVLMLVIPFELAFER